jgi:hypothetical protein
MGSSDGFSHFLFGKRPGQGGYRIVGHTPDLAGRLDELEALVRTYRFWGAQPPVAAPQALGVIARRDDLLLVHAFSSTTGPSPAYDQSRRPFVWYRFVVVPRAALAALGGRTWQLLPWLSSLPAPVVPDSPGSLAPLAPPPAAALGASPAEDAEKVRRCLALLDPEGRSYLLGAMARRAAGERLVIDDWQRQGSASARELLEALLLLTPAAYRGYVSFAAGHVDERFCDWPALVVRRGAAPAPAGARLVRAAVSPDAQAGDVDIYTRTVGGLLEDPAALPRLLAALERQSGPPPAGEQIPGAAAALPLVAVEADAARRKLLWAQGVEMLEPGAWGQLLPALDQALLPLVWDTLLARFPRARREVAALLESILLALPRDDFVRVVRTDLSARPALAEALLYGGLLAARELWADPESGAALRELCVGLVSARVPDYAGALAFARHLLAGPLWSRAADRFALLDAVVASVGSPGRLHELLREELGPLLPQVPAAALLASRTLEVARGFQPALAAYLESLGRPGQEPAGPLVGIAQYTQMRHEQRARLYDAGLAARTGCAASAVPLAADLLGAFFDEHAARGGPAGPWCGAFAGAEALLGLLPAAARELLAAAAGPPQWMGCLRLADALELQPHERAPFLDRALGGRPLKPLLRVWLYAVVADEDAATAFASGATARELGCAGTPALSAPLAVLLGTAPPDPAAGEQLIGLQQELDLEPGVLLALLERRAAAARAEGEGWRAAAPVAELRLYYREALGEGGGPALAHLRATAPLLGRLAAELQGGQVDQELLGRLADGPPEQAVAAVRLCVAAGRAELVRGRLFLAMAVHWLGRPPADIALLNRLARDGDRPAAEALLLLRFAWLPGGEVLRLPAYRPVSAEHLPALAAHARAAVASCGSAAAVRAVVEDCVRLGLPRGEQLTVLAAAPSQLRPTEQLRELLFTGGAGGEREVDEAALHLLLQVRPCDQGQEQELGTALAEVIAHELQRSTPGAPMRLRSWRRASVSAPVWGAAFEAAAQTAAAHMLSRLVDLARGLGDLNLADEQAALVESVDACWRRSVPASLSPAPYDGG